MFKVLGSEVVRSALARNTGNLVKLGTLAAIASFSASVFRQACQSYIRTVIADYESVREAIHEEAA